MSTGCARVTENSQFWTIEENHYDSDFVLQTSTLDLTFLKIKYGTEFGLNVDSNAHPYSESFLRNLVHNWSFSQCSVNKGRNICIG